MENLAAHVLRWRYALLALEVAAGAAFAYSGWRLVSEVSSPGPVEIVPGPAASVSPAPTGALPLPVAPAPKSSLALPTLPGADLLQRMSQDDVQLYRVQWQVVRTLIDGVRRYIETRVLPGALAS